ncbi:MAG: hypothetical protein ACJ0BN_19145 [Limisphaerales bacterium]
MTINRSGRVDKMTEVTRQNDRGYPTKKRRLPDKMTELTNEFACDFEGNQIPSESSNTSISYAEKHKTKKRYRFIRGPIDYTWYTMACREGASELAIYLQYKRGILGLTARIQIRPTECRELGLGERKRQRQINSLVAAGLIEADKGVGRCPIVKVIDLMEG